MEFKNKKPALLLVDIQKAFLDKDYPGTDENYVGIKRNNPKAEEVCGSILKKWRELGFLVIHVRHSSTSVNSKLHESSPARSKAERARPILARVKAGASKRTRASDRLKSQKAWTKPRDAIHHSSQDSHLVPLLAESTFSWGLPNHTCCSWKQPRSEPTAHEPLAC